jgi:hypothetical protein
MADTMVEAPTQASVPVKPTFEEAYPELARIVAKRRNSWSYISIMQWEDVSQILLLRLYVKWHLYDPVKGNGELAKRLEKWANTVITRAIMTLKRDTLGRWSRPCIGGGKANGLHCAYNKGGETCSLTPSGTQCAECPTYAKWQREREAQLHVKSQVSLENHAQEVSNVQCDFIDIEGVRDWLNEAMLKELTRWEGRVYRLSIVQSLSPAKVSEILAAEVKQRKRPPGPTEQYSYSAVLQYNRMFRGMMRLHLEREGYIR